LNLVDLVEWTEQGHSRRAGTGDPRGASRRNSDIDLWRPSGQESRTRGWGLDYRRQERLWDTGIPLSRERL